MAMLQGIGIWTDVWEGCAGAIGVRVIIHIVGTINRYRDAAGNRVVKVSTRNVEVVNVGVICVRVMVVVKNVVISR
jgi:hypothetical protein